MRGSLSKSILHRTILCFLLSLTAAIASAQGSELSVAQTLETQGIWATLGLVYIGGLLVSLTPCVYPMIPITLGIIGARNAGQKPLIGLIRSLTFVLGIVLIYAVLGLIAVKTGRQVSFAFQNPWVISTIALFFAAMGASMLDLFTIQMPVSVASKLQNVATSHAGGLTGAFLLGCVTGIVASPCGSPVLAGVIAVAAAANNTALGVLLLAFYALGIGTLFIFLGTFPALLGRLPKSGAWMNDIKKGLGVLLIAVGLYLLRDAVPSTAYPTILLIGSLLLVWLCIHFAIKAAGAKGTTRFWTAYALLCVLCCTWGYGKILAPQTATAPTDTTHAQTPTAELVWLTDLAEAKKMAAEQGKNIMIDFGAEWCAACKKLEKETFTDSRVAAELSKLVLVRVDCTEETDANMALQQEFGALSLPTIVFLNADGTRRDDLSLFQFEKPDAFLDRLAKLK